MLDHGHIATAAATLAALQSIEPLVTNIIVVVTGTLTASPSQFALVLLPEGHERWLYAGRGQDPPLPAL